MITTREKIEVVPYLYQFGSEQVCSPKEGDQAWCDMALGDIRELRTLTDGVWLPDPEVVDSGLQFNISFSYPIKSLVYALR